MSYAERIHLKRLRRKRILAQRVKSWGNVFNSSKQGIKPKIKFPTMFPKFSLTPERKKREGFFSRLFRRNV